MPVHRSSQSGSVSSAFTSLLLVAGGLTGALAMLAVVVVLFVSESAARSAGAAHGVTVNRTLKGDRMPQLFAVHPNAGSQALVSRRPELAAKLPDGCEPLVSPLANLQAARVARRCVS